MLPTDAAMEQGSNCNTIQNALQKVDVHLSFDQAAIVLIELKRHLPELWELRRKEKRNPAKQTNNTQRDKNYPHVELKKLPGQCPKCGQLPSVCKQLGCPDPRKLL